MHCLFLCNVPNNLSYSFKYTLKKKKETKTMKTLVVVKLASMIISVSELSAITDRLALFYNNVYEPYTSYIEIIFAYGRVRIGHAHARVGTN